MRLSLSSSLLILPLLTTLQSNAQTTGGPTTLQPGNPIERSIAPNESHTYTIDLAAEQYLQFVVDQRGVDLIVRVFSPTGKSLGEFDTPNGAEGPENVSLVAVTGGSYRISVSPLDPANPSGPGRYEIKTIELRVATEQELKIASSEDERKKKGEALLAEVIESIPEIRLPQTKIRIKMHSAALLRTLDEKKSATLLTEALTESRDYLATLKQNEDGYEEAFQSMQQLRYEAVQTLSLHDPEAALSLFRETRRPAGEVNQGEEDQERQFELSLASQIAAKNPKRALELAQESLNSGYAMTLVDTLRQLRRSDPDRASILAKDVTGKLLEEKLFQKYQAVELALTLIRQSVDSKDGGDRPLLSAQEYRALVQKVLNDALSTTPRGQSMRGNFQQGMLLNLRAIVGNELDTIVPGASAAIQKKLVEGGTKIETSDDWRKYDEALDSAPSDKTNEAIAQAPPEMRDHLFNRLAEKNIRQGNLAQARQLIIDGVVNPRQRQFALNNLERQAAQSEAGLGRMEEALKHVAKIEPLSERAQVLSEIAVRIGTGQKRHQALFLLETARSLLGTSIQAESQPHMNALLNLAAAFSRYDSKRGFEIFEPLVDQFNDLSNAARTINGFGGQYFLNGELSLQGGNPISSLVSPFAASLGTLSLTDFDRAKENADRIHLPEVRLVVYLEIAQQAIVPNGIYSPSAVYWNNLKR